jgi:hypothetical protein
MDVHEQSVPLVVEATQKVRNLRGLREDGGPGFLKSENLGANVSPANRHSAVVPMGRKSGPLKSRTKRRKGRAPRHPMTRRAARGGLQT